MQSLRTVQAVLEDLWLFVRNGFIYCGDGVRSSLDYAPLVMVPEKFYGSSNHDTNHIRLLVSGVYSPVEIERPLQSSEYVVFMLTESGAPVEPGLIRTVPGSWHQKLKGRPGVHISVTPMTGSVIEYFDEKQDGVVGFVRAVHDDESITFGTVGMYQPGVYDEHTIPSSVWHELRPVFISFTPTNTV